MSIKIIGAGFGRTGTLSLKVALEQLGFGACYHMTELLKHPTKVALWEQAAASGHTDWPAVFAGYSAAVDYPACQYWQTLYTHYPGAKVILTIRDFDSWYQSMRETLYAASPSASKKLKMLLLLPFSPHRRALLRVFKLIQHRIWSVDFKDSFEHKASVRAIYHQHIDTVTARIPKQDLLLFDVSCGWQPLCDFLNVAVPTVGFPRQNDRAQFKSLLNQFY